MVEMDPSLKQTMAKLRADYAARLPATVAEIEAQWLRLLAGDVSIRDDLVRAAHGIAGAAATFGLVSPGELARELELILESVPAGRAPGDAQCARAAALIDALRNAAR